MLINPSWCPQGCTHRLSWARKPSAGSPTRMGEKCSSGNNSLIMWLECFSRRWGQLIHQWFCNVAIKILSIRHFIIHRASLPHISFKITSSAQQSSFNCSVSSCHCAVGLGCPFHKKVQDHSHTLGLGIQNLPSLISDSLGISEWLIPIPNLHPRPWWTCRSDCIISNWSARACLVPRPKLPTTTGPFTGWIVLLNMSYISRTSSPWCPFGFVPLRKKKGLSHCPEGVELEQSYRFRWSWCSDCCRQDTARMFPDGTSSEKVDMKNQ